MLLSAPIFRLKRRAKLLSRDAGIPLHEALDRVAREEGFRNWSLLAAREAASDPASKLLARLKPGDLVLLAAQPGHGKTLMALELLVEAVKTGRRGVFYTLEYSETEVLKHLQSMGTDPEAFGAAFAIDTSDAISADYVIEGLRSAPSGTVAVIDYLQLLDQKRENPPLAEQVARLKVFADDAGLVIVLLSQVDRSYDPAAKALPDVSDVRLPNPLDLTLFTKTCFLGDGKIRFDTVTRP